MGRIRYQIEVVDLVNPDGRSGSDQILLEEVLGPCQLPPVQLVLFQKTDAGCGKFGEHRIHCPGELLVIFGIQLRNLLQRLLRGRDLVAQELVIVLRYAVEGRDPHAEKLVEIVGIYSYEIQSLKQRYFRTLSLLKDAVVEIHPAHIPLYRLLYLPCRHISESDHEFDYELVLLGDVGNGAFAVEVLLVIEPDVADERRAKTYGHAARDA